MSMKDSATLKRAVVSFFLFFFLFYAVTPLSIYGIEQQATHFVSQNHKGYINNIRLFIVDFLVSALSKDSDDDDGPSLHFLLLKKKALVSSDKLIKGSSHCCSFLPETAPSPESPDVAEVVLDWGSASYSAACVFPTGLSPPTA